MDFLKPISKISLIWHTIQKRRTQKLYHKYSEKLNGMVFGIQRPGNKEIFKKTTSEISFDKNLISELTPEEALMVGYMLADESFSKEKSNA